MKPFNKQNVMSYMRSVKDEHYDPAMIGTNLTTLAEDAAGVFGVDNIGGPLDDETHWIWDCAFDVSEER